MPRYEFEREDLTGQYKDDENELRRQRAKRPTSERIDRLEVKHDALHGTVQHMSGQVDAIHGFAAKADAARESGRKFTLALITTLGVAIAAILAAWARHG